MKIELHSKGSLDPETISKCAKLIILGEAIRIPESDLIDNLSASKLLCLIKDDDSINAVGAIKRIQEPYNIKISELSGYQFSTRTREIGYISVLPAYQGKGLSKAVLSSLLDNYKYKIIAVTGNERMKRTNISYGLRQVGRSWIGYLGKELTLWVR